MTAPRNRNAFDVMWDVILMIFGRLEPWLMILVFIAALIVVGTIETGGK